MIHSSAVGMLPSLMLRTHTRYPAAWVEPLQSSSTVGASIALNFRFVGAGGVPAPTTTGLAQEVAGRVQHIGEIRVLMGRHRGGS